MQLMFGKVKDTFWNCHLPPDRAAAHDNQQPTNFITSTNLLLHTTQLFFWHDFCHIQWKCSKREVRKKHIIGNEAGVWMLLLPMRLIYESGAKDQVSGGASWRNSSSSPMPSSPSPQITSSPPPQIPSSPSPPMSSSSSFLGTHEARGQVSGERWNWSVNCRTLQEIHWTPSREIHKKRLQKYTKHYFSVTKNPGDFSSHCISLICLARFVQSF